jgi:hypothetical protein
MYPYAPYFAGSAAGIVKLDTKVKDAEVFVNGAYAGTVGQLKTMMMRSGSYDISIRAAGRARAADLCRGGKDSQVATGSSPSRLACNNRPVARSDSGDCTFLFSPESDLHAITPLRTA